MRREAKRDTRVAQEMQAPPRLSMAKGIQTAIGDKNKVRSDLSEFPKRENKVGHTSNEFSTKGNKAKRSSSEGCRRWVCYT